ncbi:DUF805 domain-containing protein [Paraburkholderia sp. 2C]
MSKLLAACRFQAGAIVANRRMGAGSYLLVMSLGAMAWSLLTALACLEFAAPGRIGLADLNLAVSLLSAAFATLFYSASSRRLRDLNFPAWSVKVLSIPLIGVIVLPVLCFLSGPRHANDFGPAPAPSGFAKTTLALVSCLVALALCRWALLTYLHTRHLIMAGGF